MQGQAAKYMGAAALLAALAALLGPASGAEAQDPPATNTNSDSTSQALPRTDLKGPSAWQSLIGNTIVAASRSGGYTEYYTADGAVQHLDKDGKSAGKWSVEGQKVCFDFPEEDDRSCVDVESDGEKGAFIDEDASRDTFDVLPGNAKGL